MSEQQDKLTGLAAWMPDTELPFGLDRTIDPRGLFIQPIVYSWRVAFVRWLKGALGRS